MCGIVGMIGRRWADDFPQAVASLARRGPDDQGVWQRDDARLGHRRLSVIDLEGGHQPMATDDGRYRIVFNGEIYNFQALRQRLEQRGVRFTTRSDTEVLLKGYVAWGGQELLPQLDGMFAFAVWDSQNRKLFAARDRFGVKPFVYSTVDGFVFGSTLEPFWSLKGFPRRLNYEALRDYLASQSVMAPMTILRDVLALEPAGWLEWDDHARSCRTGRYWDIPDPQSEPLSVDELTQAADAALRESVKRQLVADVPLGAFLSGGVDSSLMVYYMSVAGTGNVKTFSVRFAEGDGYDESRYAKIVAQRFGCEHHEIEAEQIDAATFLDTVQSLDQPLADPAYLPTAVLSRHTRQAVTVAVSGDGGDEIFGGYGRYFEDESRYPPGGFWRGLHRVVEMGLLPAGLLRHTLRGGARVLWDRIRLGPYNVGRKSLKNILKPDAWQACLPQQTLQRWQDQVLRWRGVMDTDSLMRGDLWTYLSENCLVKTDRASMHHSLEVRVPMLGNPVVDLVLPQPASVKTGQGPKAILQLLAQRHLPREVWDRPKHGFSVPLKRYFQGPWRAFCEPWVHEAARLAPFLEPRAVQAHWENIVNRGRGDNRVMYTLIVLLAWMEKHKVEP